MAAGAFLMSFMGNTGLVCTLGQVQVLSPTTPLSPKHTQAHSVTGNYSRRVAVLYVRLGGQARCLLPAGLRASPL